jgi:hypothetical protein
MYIVHFDPSKAPIFQPIAKISQQDTSQAHGAAGRIHPGVTLIELTIMIQEGEEYGNRGLYPT